MVFSTHCTVITDKNHDLLQTTVQN